MSPHAMTLLSHTIPSITRPENDRSDTPTALATIPRTGVAVGHEAKVLKGTLGL